MRGGNSSLLAAAALAAAGCTADDGKVNFRAIADPLAAAAKRGSPMLAEGRGALLLGNVGTALEAFRKALRQQPDSIEALAGIAACYERMGRYDLSRVNYEAALAIAPNNPVLLNSFAASLQLQGRLAEATALRAEAAQAEAADVAVTVRMAQAEIARLNQSAAATPPVTVAAVAPVVQIAPAPPPAAPASKPALVVPQLQAVVNHRTVVGTTEWAIDVPKTPPTAGAITVALPVARPAQPAQPKAVPARRPAEKPAIAVATLQPISAGAQPRLQRLSMGEVALLTGNGPAWRAQVVAQSQRSVTARFVPLRTAALAMRPNIRLLNAARHQGLAARTRVALLDRGWRKIAVGDAAQIRARSIVLYPASRVVLGRRLAAQFGFASAMNHRSEELIVLLGRDAPALSFRRARG